LGETKAEEKVAFTGSFKRLETQKTRAGNKRLEKKRVGGEKNSVIEEKLKQKERKGRPERKSKKAYKSYFGEIKKLIGETLKWGENTESRGGVRGTKRVKRGTKSGTKTGQGGKKNQRISQGPLSTYRETSRGPEKGGHGQKEDSVRPRTTKQNLAKKREYDGKKQYKTAANVRGRAGGERKWWEPSRKRKERRRQGGINELAKAHGKKRMGGNLRRRA